MSLASTIQTAIGQPATVRIGVVASANPLVVNVQGTLFVDVGVIGAFTPGVGDTVALLGQSAVSSDGSSWLCLGEVTSPAANALNASTVTFAEDTIYTSTNVGFTTAGAPLTGVAFIAPLSGKVLLHWSATLHHNTTNTAIVSPQIATGDVLGAGTVVFAASSQRSVENGNLAFANIGSSRLLPGLTPGAVYNATLYHSVNGGTGSFAYRHVIAVPLIA